MGGADSRGAAAKHRPANAVLTVDDLMVDRVSHTVQRNGRAIELSTKEFALLEFLMRNAGQPVTPSSIVEQVWKLNFDTMTNVVDVYINYLRRKVDTGLRSRADSRGRISDRWHDGAVGVGLRAVFAVRDRASGCRLARTILLARGAAWCAPQ
jgi:hypothetical protein